MKCVNCSANAEYTYRINTSLAFNYCEKHLPKFLRTQRVAGNLKLDVPAPVVEAPKPSKKKVVEEPIVEVPVEEPAVEETVVSEDE